MQTSAFGASGTGAGITGVDVYGTAAFDGNTLLREMEGQFTALGAAIAARDGTGVAAAKSSIAGGVQARGQFASISVSPIIYYPPNPGLYVTIDVVEERDRDRRMPFRAAPQGEFEDPDTLFRTWYEYESKVGDLSSEDALPLNENCPAFHCLASFEHPDLKPYLKQFNEGAERHGPLLERIAISDADALHRTAALYLLAHTKDQDLVAHMLAAAMFDPSESVRNAGMRVLLGMALNGRMVDYPLEQIFSAMDFPATTDRNKAIYLVATLAKMPEYKPQILRRDLGVVLRLLRLQQPNNHGPAWQLLRNVSGESYAERDYASWDEWVATHAPIGR